uniref:WD_REPEATS_REGION domain-containing protein n=1 Tax=Macrostomum lignano TaxID=282301 RepID=A0A1I8FQV3_9PLAT
RRQFAINGDRLYCQPHYIELFRLKAGSGDESVEETAAALTTAATCPSSATIKSRFDPLRSSRPRLRLRGRRRFAQFLARAAQILSSGPKTAQILKCWAAAQILQLLAQPPRFLPELSPRSTNFSPSDCDEGRLCPAPDEAEEMETAQASCFIWAVHMVMLLLVIQIQFFTGPHLGCSDVTLHTNFPIFIPVYYAGAADPPDTSTALTRTATSEKERPHSEEAKSASPPPREGSAGVVESQPQELPPRCSPLLMSTTALLGRNRGRHPAGSRNRLKLRHLGVVSQRMKLSGICATAASSCLDGPAAEVGVARQPCLDLCAAGSRARRLRNFQVCLPLCRADGACSGLRVRFRTKDQQLAENAWRVRLEQRPAAGLRCLRVRFRTKTRQLGQQCTQQVTAFSLRHLGAPHAACRPAVTNSESATESAAPNPQTNLIFKLCTPTQQEIQSFASQSAHRSLRERAPPRCPMVLCGTAQSTTDGAQDQLEQQYTKRLKENKLWRDAPIRLDEGEGGIYENEPVQLPTLVRPDPARRPEDYRLYAEGKCATLAKQRFMSEAAQEGGLGRATRGPRRCRPRWGAQDEAQPPSDPAGAYSRAVSAWQQAGSQQQPAAAQ